MKQIAILSLALTLLTACGGSGGGGTSNSGAPLLTSPETALAVTPSEKGKVLVTFQNPLGYQVSEVTYDNSGLLIRNPNGVIETLTEPLVVPLGTSYAAIYSGGPTTSAITLSGESDFTLASLYEETRVLPGLGVDNTTFEVACASPSQDGTRLYLGGSLHTVRRSTIGNVMASSSEGVVICLSIPDLLKGVVTLDPSLHGATGQPRRVPFFERVDRLVVDDNDTLFAVALQSGSVWKAQITPSDIIQGPMGIFELQISPDLTLHEDPTTGALTLARSGRPVPLDIDLFPTSPEPMLRLVPTDALDVALFLSWGLSDWRLIQGPVSPKAIRYDRSTNQIAVSILGGASSLVCFYAPPFTLKAMKPLDYRLSALAVNEDGTWFTIDSSGGLRLEPQL